MPRILRCLLPGLAGLWLTSGGALAATWQVEDGSQVRFTASQQGSPVEGRFDRFKAAISFDPDDLADSMIEVEIDAASITTGHKDRDTALRSAAFFDVQQWPAARFESGKLARRGADSYAAEGRLTIRDVTKDVLLPFELTIAADPGAPDHLLAHATGELTISRLAYGVGQGDWASTKTVGDDVVIAIDLRASRPR